MKGQQLSTVQVTHYASPGLTPLIYSFCVLFRLYSVFFARSFVSLLSLFCMCVCVFSLLFVSLYWRRGSLQVHFLFFRFPLRVQARWQPIRKSGLPPFCAAA